MAEFSTNAVRVLKSRYLRKDRNGEIYESPDDLLRRVAKAIASAELNYGTAKNAEEWESTFYDMLSDLSFLPNSPTLMNAGTNLGQLSACFVLPVQDNMGDIFSTLKQAALIQQSGGGTGYNFSRLRHKGALIKETGGFSSGPLSFIEIFDHATEKIRQGGKRRGANMGVLNVDHPDITDFIRVKSKANAFRNFNFSVGVTDAFMEAVEKEEDWPLLHPVTGKQIQTIPAKHIWDTITEKAWETGDPGLIFLDTINQHNPTPGIGSINATNPCGEVPLLSYEPCNLGSINLTKMINQEQKVDWPELRKTVHYATRFLDNVIDVNRYLIPDIEQKAYGNRKIGLGVMGWAEMLIGLGIPYDSEEAVKLGETLMAFINKESFEASRHLAEERGTFADWQESIYAPDKPVRNATRTSIAPTGTISIIADASSSIEPLFALAYKRDHVLESETLYEVNQLLVDTLKSHNLYSEALLEKILEQGTLAGIDEVPETLRELFKTSLEIPYPMHIKHQMAFQKHTDNAVSKTINLAEDATAGDVAQAYKMAWEQGAKGITIYRYGSKNKQVLSKGKALEKDIKLIKETEKGHCKECVN